MSEVAATPAAPPASPPAAAVGPTPQAPAGETPAPQASETPQAPAGETPAKPEDAERADRARHRRQLNTAYRKAAEAQARAELLAKELSEFKAKQAPAASPDRPAEPRLDQFSDLKEYEAAYKKYAEGLAKYESENAIKQHQTRQQEETHKQMQARLQETWETKAERGEGKYDDWETIVGDLKPSTPWAAALMEADNADDIAYYLGKNLKEAQRIAALPPVSQIREIGRLEAKLAAEPPKPKTPSRAPAPITPVTGTTPTTSAVPSENDDMRTWMAKRQKQVYGTRK